MSITVTPGTGATVDADVIAGANTQAIKVRLGAAGVDGGLVTTANPFPVAVQGTVAISGNVGITGTPAVQQSGTWTVQPGNTANTTAWLVTGTGGTFPVTNAGLPAALGQSTMANSMRVVIASDQSALVVASHAVTNAGTFAVQAAATHAAASVASGAFVAGSLAAGAIAGLEIAPATAIGTTKGPLVQGSVTTAAPAYTTATVNALSLTTGGALRTINEQTGAAAQQKQGTVAHGAAVAQNPVQVGFETRLTNRAVTADTQVSRPIVDKLGRQIVKIGQTREQQIKSGGNINISTTETTLIAAGGAGVFLDLVYLYMGISAVGTAVVAGTTLTLRDATGPGNIVFTFRLPALAVNTVGAPIILALPQGPFAQTLANNQWTLQTSAASALVDFIGVFEKTL